MHRFLLCAALASVAFVSPLMTVAADEASVTALHDTFDEAWERDLRDNPTFASALGDRRYNDKWPDLSIASIKRQHANDKQRADRETRLC